MSDGRAPGPAGLRDLDALVAACEQALEISYLSEITRGMVRRARAGLRALELAPLCECGHYELSHQRRGICRVLLCDCRTYRAAAPAAEEPPRCEFDNRVMERTDTGWICRWTAEHPADRAHVIAVPAAECPHCREGVPRFNASEGQGFDTWAHKYGGEPGTIMPCLAAPAAEEQA